MSDESGYQYRWVNKEFTLEEIIQLLVDRIALLEGRVRELEEQAGLPK